jgi:hypothetical protein
VLVVGEMTGDFYYENSITIEFLSLFPGREIYTSSEERNKG